MFSTRVSLRDVCKSCRQASELAHYTVTVTGNVTETATGVWLAGSGSPLFSTTGLKIEFSPSTSETFKAGMPYTAYVSVDYQQIYNIRRILIGNKIVDHSDVVGASPVGTAPTTSSFST